jgi:hypothetical protein
MEREFCVEPMGMRMARRESGTNSQPIKIVKNPIRSHPNAHMTHQMIQNTRTFLIVNLRVAPLGAD